MRLLKILLALILVIKLLPFCLVYSIMLVRYPRRYLLAGEKTADLLLSFEDRLFAKIRKTWRRKKMKTVTIYTDGACSGNPGPGGWGAILIYGTHKRELSGGEADTTNNRMELTAVIQALSLLKEPCIVSCGPTQNMSLTAWRRAGPVAGRNGAGSSPTKSRP